MTVDLPRTRMHRANSRFASSQREMALLCNDVSHWLGANQESVLHVYRWITLLCHQYTVFSISHKNCSRSLHWRHNDHDGVSNHQPNDYLLNRLFRRRSKKTSKLRVTGLCVENSPGPVNSPHKGTVTRKMFPFDDVIMLPPAISKGNPRVTSGFPSQRTTRKPFPCHDTIMRWGIGP